MHYDAGAQGEHKRTRGFTPELTRSAHWLANPRLHQAVARFLEGERGAIAVYAAELQQHTAFRHG